MVLSFFPFGLTLLESQVYGLTDALSNFLAALDTWFQLHRKKADSTQDLMWQHQGILSLTSTYPFIFCKGHLHLLLYLIHTMNCEGMSIIILVL